MAYLFELWIDLARGRQPGFERLHLTWPVLDVWMRIRRQRLTDFEISVLFDLDYIQPANFHSDD